MLRRFRNPQPEDPRIRVGAPLFLVTRKGEIVEGFHIASILGELVSLDHPPLPDSEKQGFTISGSHLKPNWCAGRRAFKAAYLSREDAQSAL